MSFFGISPTEVATFINVVASSVVIILAFSILAYTITYNVRNEAARYFAIFLACIVVAYTGDVALNRVVTERAANLWLRIQWLGIAMLPWAYYVFSYSVLRQANSDARWGRQLSTFTLIISVAATLNGLFGTQLVGTLYFRPPFSFLDSGPYFWFFAVYFVVILMLSLQNIVNARRNCLTESSRKRMNYLLFGFVAPGIGIFPYLIVLGTLSLDGQTTTSAIIFLLALAGTLSVAVFLVLMSYTVAYFGVLTPDRVVRYRLIRFFTRGPAVAILVILAIQTIPRIERILGLPRDMVLFSVITGVIICSHILLSITKSFVDRLVYREDLDEAAWLRELDRRLLTTSDLRQFLENNLTALCEYLQSPSGFVAAVVGPDLMLEAMIGDDDTLNDVVSTENWSDVLVMSQQRTNEQDRFLKPIQHAGYWVWPLVRRPEVDHKADGSINESVDQTIVANGRTESSQPLGILAVRTTYINRHIAVAGNTGLASGPDVTTSPIASDSLDSTYRFTLQEQEAICLMTDRAALALVDRKLQQDVFGALRRIIPEMDRLQELRGAAIYIGERERDGSASPFLDPSPIHSPDFNTWVKDALSHYWGGPKLTRSPLTQLRVVSQTLDKADNDPTKALRLVLGSAIERLKPSGTEELNRPEWLLYNIVSMRFIEGKKVREIANRLAMSESDLYRKQRVAIGQVARVLTEMEQGE